MTRRDKLAFAIAIAILLATGAISFWALGVARESEAWVEHTHQVLDHLEGLLLAMETLESTARGYAITGEEAHLELFHEGSQSLQEHLSAVRSLTVDNPLQQSRIPVLESLAAHKLSYLEKVLALRKEQGSEAAQVLLRNGEGLQVMAQFRAQVGAMQAEELRLLNQRNQGVKRRLDETRLALILGALLGISISLAAARSVERESVHRTQAEQALQRSEKRFRGLLEAAPDAMIVIAPGGEIVLLNAQTEQLFGYRREEILWRKVEQIFPCGVEGIGDVSSSIEGKSPEQDDAEPPEPPRAGRMAEAMARRKDGSEFPVEIMLSPLDSQDGPLTTAAIRDVTERRRFEEHLAQTAGELRRSNHELQQFTYIASHDLQEPLRMVASYTQLLAERYRGRLDADADEFIRYSVEGCKRMKKLIQDWISYSNVSTPGKVLRRASSESALKAALTSLRASIVESGAIVSHDALPALTTEETRLAQVFHHLVDNAIKFRRQGVPEIHVAAARNARGEWVFSVRDNGIGIDPRYFDKIFVMFQRLHTRNAYSGTGTGLALAKKIVEGLGGSIWVESRPGKGATFYFSLPERPDAVQNAPRTAALNAPMNATLSSSRNAVPWNAMAAPEEMLPIEPRLPGNFRVH